MIILEIIRDIQISEHNFERIREFEELNQKMTLEELGRKIKVINTGAFDKNSSTIVTNIISIGRDYDENLIKNKA